MTRIAADTTASMSACLILAAVIWRCGEHHPGCSRPPAWWFHDTQTDALWRASHPIHTSNGRDGPSGECATDRILFSGCRPQLLADAFKLGLRDAGYVEGRNLTIEYRWMGGREKNYSDIAGELAQLKVDAIVTAGHPAALAAKSATSLIPIIALAVVDPVGSGLAESLSHPGGNVTGFSLETTPQTNAKMISAFERGYLWSNSGRCALELCEPRKPCLPRCNARCGGTAAGYS